MSHSLITPEKLSEMYDKASEDQGKFREMIEKNAMPAEKVTELIERHFSADGPYPELEVVEKMSSSEYAELYKKMAESAKSDPAKFEAHGKQMGMTPEELAVLFDRISGSVQKYPEVWESQEHAQLLHPRNLMMLATAFKEDTAEALGLVKGVDEE